jgi:hypothetical protein
MFSNELLIYTGTAILFTSGLLFGWWLPMVAAVMVLAVCGRFIWALVLALLLDLYFGTPVGMLHVLLLPVTVVTLAVVVCRSYLVRHLRDTRVY